MGPHGAGANYRFRPSRASSSEILPRPEHQGPHPFRFRIRGNFREASDWLSHGKSHPQPDGFSVFLKSRPTQPARNPFSILCPEGHPCPESGRPGYHRASSPYLRASNPLSAAPARSTIVFAYRAADATLGVSREARRDSRESELPPGRFLRRRFVPSQEKHPGCEGYIRIRRQLQYVPLIGATFGCVLPVSLPKQRSTEEPSLTVSHRTLNFPAISVVFEP